MAHCPYLHCSSMMFDSMGWGVPSILVVRIPDFHHIVIPPTGQKSPIGGPLQSAHVHQVSSDGGHVKLCHSGVIVVNKTLLISAAQEACLGTPCQTVDARLMCFHSTNKLGTADIPKLCMCVYRYNSMNMGWELRWNVVMNQVKMWEKERWN